MVSILSALQIWFPPHLIRDHATRGHDGEELGATLGARHHLNTTLQYCIVFVPRVPASCLSRSPLDTCLHPNLASRISHWVLRPLPGPPTTHTTGTSDSFTCSLGLCLSEYQVTVWSSFNYIWVPSFYLSTILYFSNTKQNIVNFIFMWDIHRKHVWSIWQNNIYRCEVNIISLNISHVSSGLNWLAVTGRGRAVRGG